MKDYQFVNLSVFALCLFCFFACSAQSVNAPNTAPSAFQINEKWVAQPQDSLIFVEKIKKTTGNTTPERCLNAAYAFLGTPYHSNTLNISDSEQVVVNLRGLDCWTFVETAFAMALTTRDSVADLQDFARHLRLLRYKNGTVDGYGSRLHYFTDWVLNAAEQGYGRDITQELGGGMYAKKITYITDHPKSYPRAKAPEAMDKIRMAQDRINGHSWHYIPKTSVKKIEDKIQNGDIIILTSVLSNLDVEHQGFALRGKDGVLRLLHASSTGGRVLLSGRPLGDYLLRVKSFSGIMVFRLNE